MGTYRPTEALSQPQIHSVKILHTDFQMRSLELTRFSVCARFCCLRWITKAREHSQPEIILPAYLALRPQECTSEQRLPPPFVRAQGEPVASEGLKTHRASTGGAFASWLTLKKFWKCFKTPNESISHLVTGKIGLQKRHRCSFSKSTLSKQ